MPGSETTFEAVGTRWTLTTPTPLPDRTRDRVHATIDAYDRQWSRFRADSAVTRLAQQGGSHTFPAHAAELLDLYDELTRRTAGAMTPLVGAGLEQLGYDASYRLRPAGDPVPAPRSAVRRAGTTLCVDGPVLLDVGAAGKGQLVDLVAESLRDCGVREYCVDAGGDMLHAGPRPVRVGLQVPGDPTRVVGVVELRDAALCGSASDRRAWGPGLHHILDARTGVPTQGVAATWVVARRAMVADGLATALFLTDPGTLSGVAAHSYVVLHADARVRYSSDLPGEVFTGSPGRAP